MTTIAGFGTTNKLASVTVTGAGGLSAALAGQTVLTAINASGSSGPNTITVDNTKATYTGGSGADTVTVTGVATKAINGGEGADVLFMTGTGGTILTATSGAYYSNFETLNTTGADGTFDLSFITAGMSVVQGALNGAIAYTNADAGQTLTMTASPGQTTGWALETATGTADSLNVILSSAAAIDANTLTVSGVETINITSTDTNTTAHVNTLALTAAALKSLVFSGTAGIIYTGANTTVTSVDASGLSGAFTWTTGTGNLAAAATITGSATMTNTVDFSAATTAATTYVGGAGNDVITGSTGKAATVTLGNGTNSYTNTGSAGIQTVTGGTGVDTITTGSSADVIVGGGGADVITAGAGADKITLSGTTSQIIQASGASGSSITTTAQTSQFVTTFDVVYGAAAGTTIVLGNTNIHQGLLTTAASNLAAGVEDAAVFARGTYDSDAGTFTYAANGLDSALTYDSASTAGITAETIILVGFVASSAATVSIGTLTLG